MNGESGSRTEEDRSDWNVTNGHLPPDGIVVETKLDDAKGARNQTRLKRRGRLWYFEDDSMYVYYTPTHWRYLT